MAFSSTPSIPNSFKYDVFLSFRGEDTRTNFVDHLYYALQQKNIHTYKDDERIKKGKMISNELIRSIEESRFYIIVFSKNYASSSWCLDELVKIMDCHRTNEHTAYPVFYDVEPAEVRKQSGAVGEAFASHEKEEPVEITWREALKEAANLVGWELKKTADGHEAKFIQKIVEELSLELRSISFNIDEKLVGMESRIKEVLSSLGNGFNDVHMMGIKGMGGGGKTTLARAVFDQISFQFEGKSFVENVKEVSNASFTGLKSLQKRVLSDLLNDKGISVSSVHDGKHMMKKMMRDRKVLVVLDDVDHINQLEALAGERNWFKPGSVIIITTRDEQVLVAHRLKLIHNVSLLSDMEAICLFNNYAFGRDIPIQRYQKLTSQVICYAAGLPLTIRVLGSFLCGKNELEWIDALDRLKTIPLAETLKKLELSYIGLEEDYKEMFLDIACILKGWHKDNVIKALESCGFHARNGLRVLEQKSLVNINRNSNNEWVDMHDHIEEMGRNIVRRSHPDKPHKHSRLWIDEEIEDILANDLGTKETRCIRMDTQKCSQLIVMNGFRKMKKLRFLSVAMGYRSHFWTVSLDFPNALRYLDFKRYPFRSLPETFQANNLVALKMVLHKLRFLDLSESMLSTLDLGLTPNIETLTLEGCSNLVELHIPIGSLKLLSIDLSHSRLTTLNLDPALNLETLILVECCNLIQIQMPAKCQNLRSLLLTNSKLRSLNIGLTPNLEKLDLENCFSLEEIHMSGECQKLANLDISHSKLRNLDLGLTPNLETLYLQRCCKLVELHTPTGCLERLFHLGLTNCLGFRFLFFGIKDHTSCSVLESLEVGPLAELHMIVESVERCLYHPDNNLPKLQFSCFYKEDRYSLTRNLEMLVSIGMCACTNLETFSRSICGLQRLRKLKLEGSILEAPKNLGELEFLEELILSSTKINNLPDSICMLKHLRALKLKYCLLLETLPKDIGRLISLEKLTLSFTTIKHLPDSICMLKNLKHLELHACSLLEKLPADIGQLEYLEKLILINCKFLQSIPNSICRMKCLKDLYLCHCIQIEKLPEELGSLECLKELDIEGTSICHLPQSILLLKGLLIIGSRQLLESCGFTSEIQTSEYDDTLCYVVVG